MRWESWLLRVNVGHVPFGRTWSNASLIARRIEGPCHGVSRRSKAKHCWNSPGRVYWAIRSGRRGA